MSKVMTWDNPAARAKAMENLFLFDQAPRLLHGFRRIVAVVQRDEVDLAAVDAARLVELVEIRADRLADRAVGGRASAVGVGVADLLRRVRADLPIAFCTGSDPNSQTTQSAAEIGPVLSKGSPVAETRAVIEQMLALWTRPPQ